MKKRIFAAALCLALSLTALAGCGPKEPAAGSTPAGSTPSGSISAAAPADLKQITEAMAEGPTILTSVGQSADVNVVQTLMKKCEIETDLNAVVKAEELGSYKTLVLAIGGSSKGLGAAGVDENQEMDRVNSVIAKAKENGMTIIALHIGGSARRGTLSDKFIPDALKACDAAIIVGEGDQDGLMSGILAGTGAPTAVIDNQVGAIDPLKVLFGK